MRWTLKPKPNPVTVNSLASSLGVDRIIASLLVQRGIEDFEQARRFFRPELSHLHDPYLMKDMDKAVKRIEKAIALGEKILVFGDYDVDGTTAVAMMASYLKSIHPSVETYIPDRYEEGYGISLQGIDHAARNGVRLIIALDCGIKAVNQTAYAAGKNIDLIICDHHLPGPVLPKAVAILDPLQKDCSYPYKSLSGCGVGFKLIQALAAKRGFPAESLLSYFDLVATSIAADIVPITGENRVFTYFGLHVLNTCPRPGFEAILKQVKKKSISVTDVVFIIAPRINAAGRMKHGQHAVRLLMEENPEKAAEAALEIEEFNRERREADRQITEEAIRQIIENNEEKRSTTVVYNKNWHQGVIGIVASRLTESYYRPTLVFTKNQNKLVASARSVSGFDLYSALEQCADHIENFGGHRYAAGLTIKKENFQAFKSAFEQVVSSSIPAHLQTQEVKIDAEINLNQITPKFYRILKQFAPFGPGNMKPVFMTKNLTDNGYSQTIGKENEHLRVGVRQKNSPAFTGIGFNQGKKIDLLLSGKTFMAAYSIDTTEWQGTVSLQLQIRDLKR